MPLAAQNSSRNSFAMEPRRALSAPWEWVSCALVAIRNTEVDAEAVEGRLWG